MRGGAQEFAQAGQLAGLEHLPAEFSDLGGMPQAGDLQLTLHDRGLIAATGDNGTVGYVRRLRRRACRRPLECPRGLVCQMHDPSQPFPPTAATAALQYR